MTSDTKDGKLLHWQHGPAWVLCLMALYIILACLPVIVAWAYSPRTGASFWRELAKGTALLGFSLLSLQFALAGRFKPVDRPFGLDSVMQFHKCMAMCAGLLLLAHPVLLAVEAGPMYFMPWRMPWPIILGQVALVLLLGAIAFALLFNKLGVDYQLWRAGHKFVVVVLVLGFVHSLLVGSDIRPVGMRAYWWVLFGIVMAIFAYRNLFVPFLGRRRFNVAAVTQETHDTYTVALQPADGKPFAHVPGQFHFLKLRRPGRPSEEHPFTISSSPTGEPPITSTIKESGDYTNTIGETRPGDTALVEGPYGRFSYVFGSSSAFLFIAGGVGITPILSMLRHLRDTQDPRQAILIYGNKTVDDIIRREELEAMPGNVKVVHVLEHPPEGWEGPAGYVTADVIQGHAGPMLEEADVFLCGPPPMMASVEKELASLRVPGRRIHTERFAL